jgi:putative spermidine/putrescine transport system substrate-binding protein
MKTLLNRRHINAGLLGLLAAPLLTRPSFAAGRAVAAVFPGAWEDAYRAIVAPIAAAESGVELVVAPALAQDQVAKMMATPGQPPYDALLVSPGQTAMLIEAGLIEEIDPSKLKNWHLLNDLGKTPFGPNVTIEVTGIAYNPDLVPRPAGYRDLVENPAFKDMVGWIGFGSNTATIAWVEIAKLYGGGPDNLQPVFDLIAKSKESFGAVANSGNNQMTLFQQGDIGAFISSTGNVTRLRELGVPCEFVHPETGSPALPVAIHLTKGASDPDAVYAYMDAAISSAAQSQLALPPTGMIPMNTEVPFTEDILAFVTPEQLEKVVFPDWPAINKNRAAWTAEFDRVVAL